MSFNYVKNNQNKNIVDASKVLAGMAKNDGGGASYVISKWSFLDRFLIIGADTGTYYVEQSTNQERNVDNVLDCISTDGQKVVSRIVDVSINGLSAKNDSAIYALALCFTHGDQNTKLAAEQALIKVCRTGTHILMFTAFIKSMRGFGKIVSRAINSWYLSKSDINLAIQLTKYQQREGWSHKDVFRLTHPKFGTRGPKYQIAKYVMKGELPTGKTDGQELIRTVNKCRGMSAKEIIPYIKDGGLQREHIDSELLNNVDVQRAMLPNLGGTAILRNLGNMSKSGLLGNMSDETKHIVKKFRDKEFIKNSRLHPMQILTAHKVYKMGRGMKGSSTWSVDRNISAALEDAFYLSFNNIEKDDNNYFFGLDVSGSMSCMMGTHPVSCAEVSAVMALTFAKSQDWVYVGGFSSDFVDLKISKSDNLESATRKAVMNNFGSTNPSAAIKYAIDRKINVDKFVFITDNDVNSGYNPAKYLNEYRRVMKKPNAKMIVFGLTASRFSIADPKDPLMLDCCGFTPDMTSIIKNF